MISFPRVLNLLKSQHMVRPPVLAKNLGIGFALILAAFILRYLGSDEHQVDGFIVAPMLVAALVFAELFMFKPFKESRATIFYLSVPASMTEKWLANFISSFLLLPLLVLAACYLANIVAYLLLDIVGTVTILRTPAWWDALKVYWSLHPLLFFGAIYFRTGVLFKTFGSLAVLAISSALVFFGAVIIASPELAHLDGEIHVADGHSPLPLSVLAFLESDVFHFLLTLAYFGFFWGLSLLRLREVEI